MKKLLLTCYRALLRAYPKKYYESYATLIVDTLEESLEDNPDHASLIIIEAFLELPGSIMTARWQALCEFSWPQFSFLDVMIIGSLIICALFSKSHFPNSDIPSAITPFPTLIAASLIAYSIYRHTQNGIKALLVFILSFGGLLFIWFSTANSSYYLYYFFYNPLFYLTVIVAPPLSAYSYVLFERTQKMTIDVWLAPFGKGAIPQSRSFYRTVIALTLISVLLAIPELVGGIRYEHSMALTSLALSIFGIPIISVLYLYRRHGFSLTFITLLPIYFYGIWLLGNYIASRETVYYVSSSITWGIVTYLAHFFPTIVWGSPMFTVLYGISVLATPLTLIVVIRYIDTYPGPRLKITVSPIVRRGKSVREVQ